MRTLPTIALLAASLHAAGQSAWTVEEAGIAPAGDDFAPVLMDSNLVFTSVRDRPQAIAYTDASTGKPLSDLYQAPIHGGKPGRPQLMGGTLSTPWNDGPASFSPGGDTLCITRNMAAGKGKRRSDKLGLFFAVKAHGAWGEPVPFAWNGETWSVMHGCFSPDGQWLYFASDMPGGAGGTDLYACQRSAEGWTRPENLGPGVNSAGNELFPAMAADGTLRFSSDRPGGQGKLDLYESPGNGLHHPIATALPAPVNSPGNDLGWAAQADGTGGYFSSDRTGTSRIYRFRRNNPPFRDCTAQKPERLCFAFKEREAFKTDGLPLRLEWDLGDGTRLTGPHARHCYAKPGIYPVKLDVIDTLAKSIYYNEAHYELEAISPEQAMIGGPDSAATGGPAQFDANRERLPGFTATQVQWDFGDGTLAKGVSAEHAWTAPGTYRVQMELTAAPNGRGVPEHHCVYRDVTVLEGILPTASGGKRYFLAKPKDDGYEFNFAELPNDLVQAASQTLADVDYSVQLFTSEARLGPNDPRFAALRKTYVITERFLAKEQRWSYSIGSAKTPQALHQAFMDAKANGFSESLVQRTPKDKPLALERAEDMPLAELDQRVISVSRVLYATGAKDFDRTFLASLDKVLEVVRKYPQLDLVIEAHTDNVGTEAYNMALSNGRAQGVADYFILEGIDPARLRPIGFGKSKPVTDNGTEEGRAVNRRVDFRLNIKATGDTAQP